MIITYITFKIFVFRTSSLRQTSLLPRSLSHDTSRSMNNMDRPDASTPRPSSDDRENYTSTSPPAMSSTNHRSCRRPQRSTILTACQAAALIILFFLIGKFISITNTHTPTPHHCGRTPTDAKTHSCIFNPMTYSWEPRLCHDDALTADFLKMQKWQWYLDANGQREADRDLVLAGRYEKLYVTWDYRRHQCVFGWRKLHRAAMQGKLPDSYTTDWARNVWCEEILDRRDVPLNSTDGFVRQGFLRCGLGM